MEKTQFYIAGAIVTGAAVFVASFGGWGGIIGVILGGASAKLFSAASGPDGKNRDSIVVSWATKAKEEIDKVNEANRASDNKAAKK